MADGTWEQYTANALESSPRVLAYAKNDHLGFQIYYLWRGSRRRYIPDYLVKMASGKTPVLEIKGQDDDQNRAKRAALALWVDAVNARGGFGQWCWDAVIGEPSRVADVLAKW